MMQAINLEQQLQLLGACVCMMRGHTILDGNGFIKDCDGLMMEHVLHIMISHCIYCDAAKASWNDASWNDASWNDASWNWNDAWVPWQAVIVLGACSVND